MERIGCDPSRIAALRRRATAKLKDPYFLAWNLGVTVAELALGFLVFQFSPLSSEAHRMLIFPLALPHAIALAAFCVKGFDLAPAILVGFYGNRLYYGLHGVEQLTGLRALVLLLVSLVRAAGVFLSGHFIRRLLCRRRKQVPTIDGLCEAVRFCGVVGVVGLLAEASATVLQCFTRMILWSDFAIHCGSWWLGELAATLAVSPCLIHVVAWTPSPNLRTPAKLLEFFVFGLLLTLLLLVAFLINQKIYIRPLPYLIYPFIVYSALRYNQIGWALVLLVISTVCAWTTVEKKGALYGAAGGGVGPGLIFQIELFLLVSAAASIALTASVRERLLVARKFEKLNDGLETLVQRRTEELTTANEELQASQRAAAMASKAKSDFLTNISHEIRTPLHGILGMSALILQTKLSEQQTKSMTTITECADLLLQVMNSILDLVKIEMKTFELKPAPFNIRHVLTTTMHILETVKQADAKLNWEVDKAIPEMLIGDHGRLRQCLLNTVVNALSFTREGSVDVTASLQANAMKDEDTITAFCKVDSSKLPYVPEGVMPISDGRALMVPPRCQQFLAQFGEQGHQVNIMFKVSASREKRHYGVGRTDSGITDSVISGICEATGLGLSVVQRSVELMGGRFMLGIEAGEFRTYYILLPFSLEDGMKSKGSAVLEKTVQEHSVSTHPKAEPLRTQKAVKRVGFDRLSEEVPPVLSQATTGNLRILLAEDNVVNQKIACRLLQRCGHTVWVAQDGMEAVSMLHTDRDAFDVVLMDIQMPNMDGLEATKCIREEEKKLGHKRMPVIGVTAHAMQGYRDQCLGHGMDDYLAKPFEINNLMAAINMVRSRHVLSR